MIRVILPEHLRKLARVEREVLLDAGSAPTLCSVVDALEASYPALLGTVRDQVTRQRRPFVRYYACSEDFSHEPPETPLPPPVVEGREPFLIVGAMSGG